MGDYIKREDAQKITAEWLSGYINDDERNVIEHIDVDLGELPPADVAEVVRCKDCKHYKTNIPCVGGHYNGCIEWLNEGCAAEVNEDDFCSYGEKHE